jgi:hypothetical protein
MKLYRVEFCVPGCPASSPLAAARTAWKFLTKDRYLPPAKVYDENGKFTGVHLHADRHSIHRKKDKLKDKLTFVW